MCSFRKRNCLFRLDISIVSKSITFISKYQHKRVFVRLNPDMTKFFRISHPIPPAPTTRTLALTMRSPMSVVHKQSYKLWELLILTIEKKYNEVFPNLKILWDSKSEWNISRHQFLFNFSLLTLPLLLLIILLMLGVDQQPQRHSRKRSCNLFIQWIRNRFKSNRR